MNKEIRGMLLYKVEFIIVASASMFLFILPLTYYIINSIFSNLDKIYFKNNIHIMESIVFLYIIPLMVLTIDNIRTSKEFENKTGSKNIVRKANIVIMIIYSIVLYILYILVGISFFEIEVEEISINIYLPYSIIVAILILSLIYLIPILLYNNKMKHHNVNKQIL